MKGFIAIALVVIFCLSCYVGNIVRFVCSDFASPYKSEVIHGLGIVIPPVALVTVWIDGE